MVRGILLIVVAGAVLCFMISEMTATPARLSPGTVLLGILVSLAMFGAALGTLWFGIRCPHCGLRLFGHAARNAPAGTTVRTVLFARNCPRCGGAL